VSRVARTVGLTAAVTDVFLLVAAYFGAYEVRYHLEWLPGLYNWDRYLLLLLVAIPTFLVLGALGGVYSGRRRPLGQDLAAIFWAAVGTGLLLAALAFLLKQQHQSRPLIVLYMAIAFAEAAAVRVLVRILALGNPEEITRVIVVGSGEGAERICEAVRRTGTRQVIGLIPEEEGSPPPRGVRLLGNLERLEAILRGEVVDEVIFAVSRTDHPAFEHAFQITEDLGLDAKLCLSFVPHRLGQVDLEDVGGAPVLSFSSAPSHPVKLATKRAFDLVVSSLALLVCAPLFLVVAAAIKLTDGGPVFFRQTRCGLNGREFPLYKFRSMVVDAEARLRELRARNEMSGPVFKITDDPRITRIGHFLRKTSIDELPQFWNVLVGHMSVVGPRPPLPAEVAQYERWQRRRLSVKPGITCIWQISGRNEIDFETWMRLDLAYIDDWSLWLDFKIFLKTIPAVLWGKGAR
jgi:exopolysaccharide biosynthesis polyprenyl glycosylphosphotransferase